MSVAGYVQALTLEHGLTKVVGIVNAPVHFLNADGRWTRGKVRDRGMLPLHFAKLVRQGPEGSAVDYQVTADHRWVAGDFNSRVPFPTSDWVGRERAGSPTPWRLATARVRPVGDEWHVGEEFDGGMLEGLVYLVGMNGDDGMTSDGVDLPCMLPAGPLAMDMSRRRLARQLVNRLVFREVSKHVVDFASVDLQEPPCGDLMTAASLSPGFVRGFFAAILALSGSIEGPEDGDIHVTVTVDTDMLVFLRRWLPTVGVFSTRAPMAGRMAGRHLWRLNVLFSTISPAVLLLERHRRIHDEYRSFVGATTSNWHTSSISIGTMTAPAFDLTTERGDMVVVGQNILCESVPTYARIPAP